MAYKFQIGQAALSGALEQAGEITFLNGKGPDGENIARFKTFVALEDGNVDIPKHNGTIGLQLGGATVTSTAAELNLLDQAVAGTVVNEKAVIYSDAGNVQGSTFTVPNDGTIGNAANADALTLAAAEITVKDGVDFSVATVGGFNYGGAAVTSTAAELNLLDTAVAGTVVDSKAVIYGAAGQVNATSLSASTGITGSSLRVAAFGVTNSGYVTIPKLGAELDADGENIIGIGDLGVDAAANFNGNVTIGNATSDDLVVTSRVDSDFIPKTDSARDLGSDALRWRKIYADEIVGADLTLDVGHYGASPYVTTISGSTDFALIKSGSTTGLGGAIYTLPSAVKGKVLHVKLSGSQANVTLKAAADDRIEDTGAAGSIYLESTGSAVTLVAMDETHWFII